jgi:hypothetical protein
MSAYNVVRMKVKSGREKEFIEQNKGMDAASVARMRQSGLRRLSVIKTGDRAYCIIGEWDKFDSIVKSRPDMIKSLDSFRPLLEDLGSGLGLTDPVSGETIVEL